MTETAFTVVLFLVVLAYAAGLTIGSHVFGKPKPRKTAPPKKKKRRVNSGLRAKP